LTVICAEEGETQEAGRKIIKVKVLGRPDGREKGGVLAKRLIYLYS